MALVLGVSLGPHATTVEVRHAGTGALRSGALVEHTEAGADDEPAVWWRALIAAITRAGEPDIAALAVTGDHPGLVLLDQAGVPLRAARSWDAAKVEVPRVVEAVGRERWARRAGLVPAGTTPVTRLAWLRRTDPRSFDRIGTVLQPHEWLTYRLAGRAITDRASASGTGLWSPHTGRWIPEALELVAPEGRRDTWPRHLPVVIGPREHGDWLDAPVFDQLPLRGRPLVAPGTAAPAAVSLALGLGRGTMAVALGEGAMALAPLDAPLVDPSGTVASRADATGRHLAVAGAAGGAALTSAVAELVGASVEELGRAALDAPAAGDLVVVAGVDGRPGAVVTGLGTASTREALARATFDGVACAGLAAVEALVASGVRWFEHEPIHLAGPPEGLDTHARTLATLAGRAVVTTGGHAAAAGACVQAAAVLAGLPPEEVALAWGLGRGPRVQPGADPDRDRRRAVHAAEAKRQLRAWGP